MREMKESGIPWIKELPCDWKIEKGKHILNLLKRPVRDTDEVVTCFRDGEVILRSLRRTEGFTMSDKEIGYQGINEGDIVIHGMDGFAGSMGVSKSTGKGSPVLIVCSPKDGNNSQYIIYYLKTLAMTDVFIALATGIRERSCDLRWNKISDLQFAIPSSKEQERIVAFLDEKCSEIDSLISLQDDMIAKLQEYKQSVITEAVTRGLDSSVPMKDSGIEWIGEIPEHWELMRLNELGNYKRGPFGSALKVDSFVPKSNDTVKVYIQQNVIQRDHTLGDYYISPDFFESSMNVYEVTQGDLLVTCDGTIGEIYLLPFNAERGILSSSLMRMRMNETYLNVLYFIYLFDIVLKQTLHVNGNGAAMKHIPPFNIFKKIKLPIPAIEEQKEILSFLDHKCSEIDSLIDIKKQKIEALKEYKKSLIYECVTGKKEIA